MKNEVMFDLMIVIYLACPGTVIDGLGELITLNW